MTDLETTARELCERWFDKGARASWCPEMVNEFTQALAAEREACAHRVSALMGKDCGNWDRAIVHALYAIRAGRG